LSFGRANHRKATKRTDKLLESKFLLSITADEVKVKTSIERTSLRNTLADLETTSAKLKAERDELQKNSEVQYQQARMKYENSLLSVTSRCLKQ